MIVGATKKAHSVTYPDACRVNDVRRLVEPDGGISSTGKIRVARNLLRQPRTSTNTGMLFAEAHAACELWCSQIGDDLKEASLQVAFIAGYMAARQHT
jgi:hypothetical protein